MLENGGVDLNKVENDTLELARAIDQLVEALQDNNLQNMYPLSNTISLNEEWNKDEEMSNLSNCDSCLLSNFEQ